MLKEAVSSIFAVPQQTSPNPSMKDENLENGLKTLLNKLSKTYYAQACIWYLNKLLVECI